MAASEFELIARYFAASAVAHTGEGVVLGIGDDAAILRPPSDEDLVISIDTVVSGTHFPPGIDASDIGYRALAVNLSDLAAMGARPLWFTLALTMPSVDEAWLEGFCAGLFGLAARSGIALVGGDTTRGPLSITIQVHGSVPRDAALRRDGARPGDELWVSGSPGMAALGLKAVLGDASGAGPARSAFLTPEPRLALGAGLRGLATAAVDVSDGLLADAGHIAERSGLRLVLDADALPLASLLQTGLDRDEAAALCLGGGDDYELCFCAPPSATGSILALAGRVGVPCTRIGRAEHGSGVVCPGVSLAQMGYQHFSEGRR